MNRIASTLRVAAVLLAAAIVSAQAQAPAARSDFPNKPIRMVVTFPPGGSADAVVRKIVPHLNEKLGQQVVDNRPGAGGNIGLTIVVPADVASLVELLRGAGSAVDKSA